ncbi:MAG: hypothetical protein U9Q85_04770 [Patescibacteria group bacterium]|nr:hypothetical protein [Patescibacteria group bacterium]
MGTAKWEQTKPKKNRLKPKSMHVYVYDTYVSEKKYAAQIAKIETRITDLGLNGKIIRLGLISSIDQAIISEIKKGAKTIVMVGGVKLLHQGVNALAKIITSETLGQNIPLAFIPVGKDEFGAGQILGLKAGEEACNVLSQRRIKEVGLGKADNNYFLFSAQIATNDTILEIDENYTIKIKKPGLIKVENLKNTLNLLITTKKRNKNSLFPFKNLLLSDSKHPLILDFVVELNLPVKITTAKEKINLIVGSSREF